MRNTIILLGLAAVTTGCARKLEPTSLELGDLLRETFRDADFDEADDDAVEALQARLLQLEQEMLPLVDAEDLRERALEAPDLTAEYLDGLPQPPDTNLEDQTPTVNFYRSSHNLQAHLGVMADTNQNCLGSDSTVWADRRWTGNEDCFFDGSCQHATAEATSRTENILAKVWIDSFSDFHRLTLPLEDGDKEVVLSRGWIAEIFEGDGGGAEWRQRYVLDVFIPDGDTTLRAYAFWSEAKIPGVGDDLYVSQVKSGVEENFLNVDAFLDGEICEDRDKSKSDWE